MDSPESGNTDLLEQKSAVFNPHLIVGVHEGAFLFSKSEGTATDELRRGNLDSHIWNGQVTTKLQRFKPDVIAVDSLRPKLIFESNGDYSKGQKEDVWIKMPGNPREINDNSRIGIVCGDLFYQDIPLHLANALSESLPEEDRREFFRIFKDKTKSVSKSETMSMFDETASQFISGLALSAILIDAASKELGSQKK